jgi:hypothetical protein
MGLLVTEVSAHGVVMIGDGQRVLPVPSLPAVVGFWGMDEIEGRPTMQWLADFLRPPEKRRTLGGLAQALADEVTSLLGPIPDGNCNLGFHVAGHEKDEDLRPSFYHVHAGPSQMLAMRGTQVDGTRFNANHDLPPNLASLEIDAGGTFEYRNGDCGAYAALCSTFQSLFAHLRNQGIEVPCTPDLEKRAEYLAFLLLTTAGLCRFSDLGPLVADDVRFVALTPERIGAQGRFSTFSL